MVLPRRKLYRCQMLVGVGLIWLLVISFHMFKSMEMLQRAGGDHGRPVEDRSMHSADPDDESYNKLKPDMGRVVKKVVISGVTNGLDADLGVDAKETDWNRNQLPKLKHKISGGNKNMPLGVEHDLSADKESQRAKLSDVVGDEFVEIGHTLTGRQQDERLKDELKLPEGNRDRLPPVDPNLSDGNRKQPDVVELKQSPDEKWDQLAGEKTKLPAENKDELNEVENKLKRDELVELDHKARNKDIDQIDEEEHKPDYEPVEEDTFELIQTEYMSLKRKKDHLKKDHLKKDHLVLMSADRPTPGSQFQKNNSNKLPLPTVDSNVSEAAVKIRYKLAEDNMYRKQQSKEFNQHVIHMHQVKRAEADVTGDSKLKVILKPVHDNISYPGKAGAAVAIDRRRLPPGERAAFDRGFALHSYNEYVSNTIPVDRSVPDDREEDCKHRKFPDDLPDTSVIICFHNEAWSVLLRTVHSVINKSPPKLLKEIILVDDYSDLAYLGTPLDKYMARFGMVKVLHATRRLGLIRARLQGVAAATGQVLTFLDSHVECQNGWLEALLAQVALGWNHVAWPSIPTIDEDTFEFQYMSTKDLHIGGFYWDMNFHWISIPEEQQRARKSISSPVRSPTMAGGLFSINKRYFEYLGSYDPGMEIWGAENMELSFKVWMCGGVIEVVPCSIVGHVFRTRSNLAELRSGLVVRKNTARLVEVWLDEYKDFYYEMLNFRKIDYGDVSDRLALKQRLNCKSFDWYMKNINPSMFVPSEVIVKGAIISFHSPHLCLAKSGKLVKKATLNIRKCSHTGGLEMFYLTKHNELRHQFVCLDSGVKGKFGSVGFFECHGQKGPQVWLYRKDKSLYNPTTHKCLETNTHYTVVKLSLCTGKNNQKWKWKLGKKTMKPQI